MAQGSHYSQEVKNNCAVLFALSGNYAKVARESQVPESTIKTWANTPEWDELVAEVRLEKSQEHIAAYSSLTDKALVAASNGIDALGDRELTPNDIKALTVTAAAATDKARLIAGLATSRSESAGSIKEIAAEFIKLSQANAQQAITAQDNTED